MTTAFVPSAAPWPPPPDLESIRELVRAADPEGLIAEGSPPDEYDPEEESIFAGIAHLATNEITPAKMLPIIKEVWCKSFAQHGNTVRAEKQRVLEGLAEQIAHFFGPEAQPLTRQS